MSLDLGELVGTLRMDVTPFDQALSHGESALNSFAGTAKASAKTAGVQATEGLGAGLAGMETTAKSSASGVDAALGSALAGMDGTARAAGSAAASALGAGLDGAEAEAKEAGSQAASGFSDSFKDGAKTAGAAGGAVLGTAIGAGLLENMSAEAGLNKLGVQLGLSQGDMKIAGQVAGQVYANNFGEDLPQINEALRGVIQNMNIEVDSVDLQPITEQVLTVADAFDQDLGMTTAAVGQMIRTGMVKDAQEGLDILTAGLQTPANKADDLAETMNEYGTQFRKLGLDGKDAMGLLSLGLQGGARDADIVADSLKEFTLKTQESTTMVTKLSGGETALNLTPLGAAFEAIGVQVLDANGNLSKAGEIFQKDLAGGGPKAKKALDQVLDGIQKIESPAERTATMVALFGTQAEDMGDALLNMDLDKAAGEIGKVEGAAKDAVDQMGTGSQAQIGSWGRKIEDMGKDAIDALGPLGSVAGMVVGFLPVVASVVGPVVGAWLAMSGASLSGAAAMAGAWLVAIWPIALVIAAVVGLAVIIYKNWDAIKEYTVKAWNWIVDAITSVPEKIGGVAGKLKEKGKDFLQGLKDGAADKWEAVKSWVSSIPDKVGNAIGNVAGSIKSKGKDFLQGMKDGITEKWEDVRSWVSGVPEKVGNAIGGVASTLKEKGKDFFGGLKDGITEKWEDVKTWVSGVPEKVVAAVGNGLTVLSSVGKDMVTGMWNGISSMTEWLKTKVWDWVKSVLPGPVEKALGISSPSKLFRNMMRWVPVGAALGIDDGTPILQDAVAGMIDTVTGVNVDAATIASGAPRGIPESAEVARYAAGQGAAAAGVTQHIYETTNAQATAAESARRLGLAGAGA